MRFAVAANDSRLVDLVRLLDRDGVSVAQTWRAVGEGGAARALASRRLVRLERRRREIRAQTIEALRTAASGFAAGRALPGADRRPGANCWQKGLVFNEHKPP